MKTFETFSSNDTLHIKIMEYIYELMNAETGEQMGLYTSLDKAKETVYDMEKRRQSMQVNRIPLNSMSFFGEHIDCVWEIIICPNTDLTV